MRTMPVRLLSTAMEPRVVGLGTTSADLAEQLRLVHGLISARCPLVDRISVVMYDPVSDLLRPFVTSDTAGAVVPHTGVALSDLPVLAEVVRARKRYWAGELSDLCRQDSDRGMGWALHADYRSGFVHPVFQGQVLAGFLMYDARRSQVFGEDVVAVLDGFSDLISHMFLAQRRIAHGMVGTIQVAVDLARLRDFETGQHLERIAYYSRIMALALAARYQLSDEYVEYLQLFAPLHDIGKVGIPDYILLKPGRFDPEEYAIMQRHVTIGEEIIERISHDMGLHNSLPERIMRNIVATHHERGDGSGYPRGLTMAQIPLEGRIVAVADVFDALTNRRAYKESWAVDAVAAELRAEAAAGLLDAECVEILLAAKDACADIQQRFADRAS